jgi:hypothetical protein
MNFFKSSFVNDGSKANFLINPFDLLILNFLIRRISLVKKSIVYFSLDFDIIVLSKIISSNLGNIINLSLNL